MTRSASACTQQSRVLSARHINYVIFAAFRVRARAVRRLRGWWLWIEKETREESGGRKKTDRDADAQPWRTWKTINRITYGVALTWNCDRTFRPWTEPSLTDEASLCLFPRVSFCPALVSHSSREAVLSPWDYGFFSLLNFITPWTNFICSERRKGFAYENYKL